MKLSSSTMLFNFCGIPILGSQKTGNVIGLSAAGYELCSQMSEQDISQEQAEAVDPQLAMALIQGGFVEEICASGSFKKSELSEELKPTGGVHASKLKTAYVHVTQRCNLSCFGCYSSDETRNKQADEEAAQFIYAFEQLAAFGIQEIIISGGEPFLRSDLDVIAKGAKEAGITSVTVLSNGLLIDRETIAKVAPFVDCVSISFDGLSQKAVAPIRGKQNYDKLREALEIVKDAGIRAHIIATIHRQNTQEMMDYLCLSQELGVTLNYSLLSCCDSLADDHFSELIHNEESLRQVGRNLFQLGSVSSASAMDTPLSVNLSMRNGCGAATSTLSIAADGTVYPCHMLHTPEMALGNIFCENIEDILNSKCAKEFACLNVYDFEKCSECEFVHFCGGGCRARAFFDAGKIDAPDSFCPMVKEFYGLLGSALADRYGVSS